MGLGYDRVVAFQGKRWRFIKPGYLLLAVTLAALGVGVAVPLVSLGNYLALPIPLVLFWLSAARIVHLGWQVLTIDERQVVFFAPFWFSRRVALRDAVRVETVRTDSQQLEESAGRGFEAHTPKLAEGYSIARRIATWFLRSQQWGYSASSVVPLLAIRFWLEDGSRRRLVVPADDDSTTAVIESVILEMEEARPSATPGDRSLNKRDLTGD